MITFFFKHIKMLNRLSVFAVTCALLFLTVNYIFKLNLLPVLAAPLIVGAALLLNKVIKFYLILNVPTLYSASVNSLFVKNGRFPSEDFLRGQIINDLLLGDDDLFLFAETLESSMKKIMAEGGTSNLRQESTRLLHKLLSKEYKRDGLAMAETHELLEKCLNLYVSLVKGATQFNNGFFYYFWLSDFAINTNMTLNKRDINRAVKEVEEWGIGIKYSRETYSRQFNEKMKGFSTGEFNYEGFSKSSAGSSYNFVSRKPNFMKLFTAFGEISEKAISKQNFVFPLFKEMVNPLSFKNLSPERLEELVYAFFIEGGRASEEVLKIQYRHLMKTYHPDYGGDNATAQNINITMEKAKKELL